MERGSPCGEPLFVHPTSKRKGNNKKRTVKNDSLMWAILGLNQGPPDYESVAKYSELCYSEWFNELFYNLLCMICVSC